MDDGQYLNIADRLRHSAAIVPGQRAVVFPHGRDQNGRVAYTHLTFRQLDEQADLIARGLIRMGVRPGDRLVLMVRPSLEFIALTFGIFRSGAICTLIDPGMGRGRIFNCLDEVNPDGFVAIPAVHLIRRTMFRRFRSARFNVVVGAGARLLGCRSYPELLAAGDDESIPLPQMKAVDPAAIIFTSGSTGPPKGVLYEHGMFDGQVTLIRDHYGVQPGEVDLPGFPLFALFNVAMQVTTVIPDMNPTRPAMVNPKKILEAIADQEVTQAFGSPALWNRVGRYCETYQIQLPSLRRVLSAGAPVPEHVLRRMTAALSENADLFTPYGATECLPVASIGGRSILNHASAQTAVGRGTCVGKVFSGMTVRIIRIVSGPVACMDDAVSCAPGEIGEIVVSGPVATREYFCRPDATAAAKIPDGDRFWHRMGDVGYLDDAGLLWFCGRKDHVVSAENGPMYSVCCEAIFNCHPKIFRSALVGVGSPGSQIPVIVAEPESGQFPSGAAERTLRDELLALGQQNPLTVSIRHILFLRALPVDTRHNVKINREQLRGWAAARI
jgi:acyl-CoA synthetase (AMP-forming)/AMP-acid ligase II